ncbi:hypothetical protein H2203_002845 [Taxawa tesnikishii (nom. ined.)]|nr:hypothetical protein H2203_002845 [Dothideales sp. JES 119]
MPSRIMVFYGEMESRRPPRSLHFRLLDLPEEIRYTIYSYALADSQVLIPWTPSGLRYCFEISALTRVCKQIREESLGFFYAVNHFLCPRDPGADVEQRIFGWYTRLDEENAGCLRNKSQFDRVKRRIRNLRRIERLQHVAWLSERVTRMARHISVGCGGCRQCAPWIYGTEDARLGLARL